MLIIGTGGTFDKDYQLTDGSLVFAQSCITELLREARITAEHRFVSLMKKDSLDLTLTDRLQLLEVCRAAYEKQIVIVHGTDTMAETANFLQQDRLNKTIVLTGAIRPHAFGHSDAGFNLGYAIACSQHLTSGIYIAMQGECFTAGQVMKDKQRALFVRAD
jgi:L-asparaginase